MNNKVWLLIAGICLLGMGYFGGNLVNRKPEVIEEVVAEVTPMATVITPTVQMSEKGTVSGYLIYPSEGIPAEIDVCAENIADTKMVNCVKQIKDKKYLTGVGYQMDLSPGNYYVYASYKEIRAYYDEYVICGLKAECKSHTKIPVVVTVGSNQDQILPHDWYNNSPTVKPTLTSTPSPTPTVKTVKQIVTIIKINPNIKLLTTIAPTPTSKYKVLPSLTPIKIYYPKW